MSEKIGKELSDLFIKTLKEVQPHKVEGHGLRVKVQLASYGEIEFETTPPAVIAGGGGGSRPPRKPKGVSRKMVEDVLLRYQDKNLPIEVTETDTHIIVKPTAYLADNYGLLKDAFIKMCGSHQPWIKEEDGSLSRWEFLKQGATQ